MSGLTFGGLMGWPLLYLLWIYAINLPARPPVHYAIFLADAGIRIGLMAILIVGSIELMRRRRRGAVLLVSWALVRLVWPAISAPLFLSIGEPSPELLAAALPAVISFRAEPFWVGLAFVSAVWLAPSTVVLVSLIWKRREIRGWSA